MRLPIKLNKAGWPPVFGRLSFAFDDPRPLAGAERAKLLPAQFSQAISTLQFGVTFKTTRPGRQEYSNRYISDLYRGSRPVVLDVGASDGSTSLDLIRSLDGFERYYVTDLNLSTRCGHDGRGVFYFMDREGKCALRASKRFLVYSEVERAWLALRVLARLLISGARRVDEWDELLLVQPELAAMAERNPRISIMRYDMFNRWNGQPPDLIKIANLLNPKYFSDAQMKEAVRVQCSNLAPNGRLLLVSEDDDIIERFSVFRKTVDGMVLEYSYHQGAKAAPHVPQTVELKPVLAS
jgi:hypothetical protein